MATDTGWAQIYCTWRKAAATKQTAQPPQTACIPKSCVAAQPALWKVSMAPRHSGHSGGASGRPNDELAQ